LVLKKYGARAEKTHDVKQAANPRRERPQRDVADQDKTEDQNG